MVPISAKKGMGIDDLLETLCLVSEARFSSLSYTLIFHLPITISSLSLPCIGGGGEGAPCSASRAHSPDVSHSLSRAEVALSLIPPFPAASSSRRFRNSARTRRAPPAGQ